MNMLCIYSQKESDAGRWRPWALQQRPARLAHLGAGRLVGQLLRRTDGEEEDRVLVRGHPPERRRAAASEAVRGTPGGVQGSALHRVLEVGHVV